MAAKAIREYAKCV